MDNKVLDEAVEVLVTRLDLNPDYFGTEEIRESFLAGVKVLLGEPVGWQRRIRGGSGNWTAWTDWEDLYGAGMTPKIGRWDAEYRPVYAPSLGEGDANA